MIVRLFSLVSAGMEQAGAKQESATREHKDKHRTIQHLEINSMVHIHHFTNYNR